MTEFELIYRYFEHQIQDKRQTHEATVTKGLGDDAAVISLPAAAQWITCVDTLIQGRHFSDDWHQVDALAFAIGYKAVAVNVSDLAAMGAKPHSILLALSLPERLANEDWLSDFSKGLYHACEHFGVSLIGGDTTRNDKLVISITANGLIDTATHPIYRSGAQVGDKVYVSGTLGDAAYALNHLDTQLGKHLSHRLHMPTPRLKLGYELAVKKMATSMIDVSDGLVQDLSHICQQSGVAMQIELDHLPTSKPLLAVPLDERLVCQISGGDDYELAFTLPQGLTLPEEFIKDVFCPITCIGKVISGKQRALDSSPIELIYQGNAITENNPYPFTEFPDLTGYQHFKN